MSETTRVMPAEPFWETISAEQMEARFEFCIWTAKEEVKAETSCALGADCTGGVTFKGELSSSQSWGSGE